MRWRLSSGSRAQVPSLLLCLVLCWPPGAHANLLPEIYLFNERPAPVPLALGSVLFYFYQDDFPATLQEALYVEQRYGANVPERDLLLLAKGSAALGLGMLQQARTWLAQVNPARLPPEALPRLHLAMARIAFLDGDDALAGQYLQQLSPELDARPDVNYLRAEIARRGGDLRAMTAALARLPVASSLWFFGWHNYGIAAHDQHADDVAASAFDKVANAPPSNLATQDVTVRAGLQGALLRFQQGDVSGAIQRLDTIPVAGSYGRMALAQRAELALAASDYATAARVFGQLAGPAQAEANDTAHDPALEMAQVWDSHRVDALIGASFAEEKLAGGASALPKYEEAARQLEVRLHALEQIDSGLDERGWLTVLAEGDRGKAGAQAARLRELDSKFAGVDWLAWLAQRDTQRHLAGWRRLELMNARIALLKESALALGEAAVEQERRVAHAGEQLRVGDVGGHLARLQTTLAATQEKLQSLRTMPPVQDAAAYQSRLLALATNAERDQLLRLQQMALLGANNGKPELVTRVHRLQGILAWQIADDAAGRIWAQEKQRRAVQGQVQTLAIRATRITNAEAERAAQSGATAKVDGFGSDLAVLQTRLHTLTDERAQALTAQLRARIRSDRADTRKQLTYAQLAVARISDQLMTDQRGAQ